MKQIKLKLLNNFDIDNVLSKLKNKIENQDHLEINDPYELTVLNLIILATKEKLKSKFNIDIEFEIISEFLDQETGMIGENNIDWISDELEAEFNVLYKEL